MLRFMVSFAWAWGVLLAWAVVRRPWWAEAGYEGVVAAKLLALPVAAGWIAVEIAARVRRPRAMRPRVRATLRLVVSGLVAGTASVLVSASVLAAAPLAGWDWAVVAGAASAAAAGAVWTMPRRRAGTCDHCGYEVGALARCPECGMLREASGFPDAGAGLRPVRVAEP